MTETSRAAIEKTLRAVAGNPTSGAVADVIPAMVDALVDALDESPKPSQRIVKANETR